MEKDFHYHFTYAAAKLTCLPNPEIVAYSCQFVDDNNEGQFAIGGGDTLFPERLKTGGGYYYPVMTQSLSPKSLDPYVQKYVYLPFHFLPGDNTVEIEKKKNPLCTTPNSGNAKNILEKALNSGNPYQAGIALHTFADTWSHQNFTGLREEWNAIYPWYDVFKSLVPNIGHAEAGHSPDVISERWTDYRFKGVTKEIDNRQRAFDAIEAVYLTLRKATGKGALWNDVKTDFEKIIGTPDYDKRIEATSKLAGGTPEYSKDAWIGAALEKEEDGEVVMKQGFDKTPWYHFHQAAKVHLATVMELIKGI
ncbi:MAG: hypothetical protein M0Z79_06760 [Nitrospiraceae bacterium]|nr:hypothetical protein [Nitrospiraceae bacterium]